MISNPGTHFSIGLPDDIIRKWQASIDIIAHVVQVPVALVMRLSESGMEVLVSNRTEGNPYKPGKGNPLEGSGRYCDNVIRNREKLLVPNALKDDKWKDSPDIKLGMISYLGFPILLPDGTPFGTICVIDNKENHYGEWVDRLMDQFRDLFEAHLALYQRNERLSESLSEISRLSAELEKAANSDPLTGLFNRRVFPEVFDKERSRHGRTGRQACFIMGDLDGFKRINDTFGHSTGDKVLVRVAKIIESRARHHDYLWRWGGDEFLALLPETPVEGGVAFAMSIIDALSEPGSDNDDPEANISMCFGITGLLPGEDADSVIARCDDLLYKAKAEGQGKIKS